MDGFDLAALDTLRWKGGALTEIDLALPRERQATIRTDEDTVTLVRRLAAHYPRRHTQPAGPQNCKRPPLRRQPRLQPAPAVEHPVLRSEADRRPSEQVLAKVRRLQRR
jgi:hypothetical protein